MSYLLKLVHKPLSDDDLRRVLGDDLKILKYSDLDNYNDLDELLPNPVDYCIILYEERLNSGHWVCLCKYDGIIEYFDPYGFKPDRPLKWISMKKRRMLDQDTPDLTHLLGRERYISNSVKYQDPDDFVNTCGSHCCHRIYRLKNGGTTLEQYHDFMKSIQQRFDIGYDFIVDEFVRKFLL